jgi:phospho-N-acetylmuramoyl-pentapeptide-transferase
MLFANIRDNMYVKASLLALIWLGGLGGVDDWFKLRRLSGQDCRDGLKMWEKMVFQIGLAVLVSIYLWNFGESEPKDGYVNPAHHFYLPFCRPIALNQLMYIIIAVMTIVGSSNAVNLTDGMDGLAAGCVVIAAAFFLVLSEVVGVPQWQQFANFFNLPLVKRAPEMSIVCASMMGACLGFLWYNAHPAQVFMGDTGSLPLGGLLGYTAIVTRHEVLLLVAGGVFVMEAASVVLQVGYFKYTKHNSGGEGKRLFRCAPLHHHFHLGGWAETKVVARFWILGIIFAALALATLKLR